MRDRSAACTLTAIRLSSCSPIASSAPSGTRSRRPAPLQRALVVAAALVAALGTGSCRTRLPGYDEDLGPPPVDAFDAALPLDLTVPRDNCGDYLIETTRVIRADMLVVQDKSRSKIERAHV